MKLLIIRKFQHILILLKIVELTNVIHPKSFNYYKYLQIIERLA